MNMIAHIRKMDNTASRLRSIAGRSEHYARKQAEKSALRKQRS